MYLTTVKMYCTKYCSSFYSANFSFCFALDVQVPKKQDDIKNTVHITYVNVYSFDQLLCIFMSMNVFPLH